MCKSGDTLLVKGETEPWTVYLVISAQGQSMVSYKMLKDGVLVEWVPVGPGIYAQRNPDGTSDVIEVEIKVLSNG